jgi:thiamine-phosphate pyrophosphorylase
MTIPHDFGLYGILTDPEVGYERLAQLMVERQLAFVQLRMKGCSRDEVWEMARRLRRIVVSPSRLIINDDPEIAAEVDADGVHLGQGDMPYAEARRIVGPDAIVGLSTHNADQTRAACALGPDYIGVGPVFPTPTKQVADPAIGLAGMKLMLSAATVPAVVLGSVDHDNAAELLAAGATNLCAVRPINRAADPGAAIDRFQAILTLYRRSGSATRWSGSA